MQLLTSVGEIILNKSHPLAVVPSGFKISPYLQEQMCRLSTNMTFDESEEKLNKLLGIKANAKQIERLCHHYGKQLEHTDWRAACPDGVQLRILFNKELYILMDGQHVIDTGKEAE